METQVCRSGPEWMWPEWLWRSWIRPSGPNRTRRTLSVCMPMLSIGEGTCIIYIPTLYMYMSNFKSSYRSRNILFTDRHKYTGSIAEIWALGTSKRVLTLKTDHRIVENTLTVSSSMDFTNEKSQTIFLDSLSFIYFLQCLRSHKTQRLHLLGIGTKCGVYLAYTVEQYKQDPRRFHSDTGMFVRLSVQMFDTFMCVCLSDRLRDATLFVGRRNIWKTWRIDIYGT
jgi:hypothetical protein